MSHQGSVKAARMEQPPLPILGLLYTIPLVLIKGLYAVASVPVRRLLTTTDLSFGDDLLRAFLRQLLSSLPASVKLYATALPNVEKILDLPRFKSYRSNICKQVSTNEVSGYWVCRNLWEHIHTPGRPSKPTRKVTLFWIHGGAYVLGNALMAAQFQIRLAELLAPHGIELSVFALAYSLGPDAKFPTQQQQAVAAYRYLVETEKLNPKDIIVVGDSAGAHLVLTLLQALQQPNQKALAKPGGALLMYPWVNLLNSGASYETNKNKCMLDRSSLNRAVDDVVGGPDAKKRWSDMLDFSASRSGSGATWKDLLPNRTWVNVGSHDLFLSDIQTFYRNATKDGAVIELDVTKGKPHGWQMMENQGTQSAYTALASSDVVPDGYMSGCDNVASGLLNVLNMM